MLTPGTRVSRYVIRARLGAGAMGEVYQAHDERLERDVALKLLPRDKTTDALAIERFLREAKATSALNHPNIVTVYEISQSEYGHVLAMELVEGWSLRLVIENKPSLDELVHVGRQLAQALKAAHALGIAHRDIKPENVMLRPDGYVKVLDFGIARLASPQDALKPLQLAEVTTVGVVIGTARYMSPEQARGDKITTATDIFSLGLILFEWAAGRHPYASKFPMEVLRAIMSDEPPPLARWRVDLPAELEALLRTMLAKDPQARPSAEEMARSLSALTQARKAPASALAARPSAGSPPAEARAVPASAGAADQRPRAVNRRLWPGLRRATTRRRNVILTGVVIGLFLLLVAAGVSLLRRGEPSATNSVAVLPFANLSPDKESEYFSDGVTDALIDALTKVDGLRVVGRASSSRFKGKQEDVQQIGQQLNVGTVLTGSVQQSGHRLRITTQLINVANGLHFWSEKFDRELKDVFAVQDEIARRAAEALKGQLLPEARQRISTRGTDNLEAYDLYLRGRFLWNRRTAADLQTAITLLTQATAKSPDYAQAHAGLASAYAVLPAYAYVPMQQVVPQAKAAAHRALELDPRLAEPHAVLGFIKESFDWDRPGAEKEYQQAITLDPNFATAHHWYGVHLLNEGRLDQALPELRQAQELEPLSPIIGVNLGVALAAQRQLEEALVQFRRVLELDPDFPMAWIGIGDIAVVQERIPDAVSSYSKGYASHPDRFLSLGRLGYAQARAGRQAEARQALRQLTQSAEQGRQVAVPLALVHLGLGETDQTFHWLDRAFAEHDHYLLDLKIEPLWAPLRNDPRFQALLRKIGLER